MGIGAAIESNDGMFFLWRNAFGIFDIAALKYAEISATKAKPELQLDRAVWRYTLASSQVCDPVFKSSISAHINWPIGVCGQVWREMGKINTNYSRMMSLCLDLLRKNTASRCRILIHWQPLLHEDLSLASPFCIHFRRTTQGPA